MPSKRSRWVWAAGAGIAALASAGAQRRHMQRIAADPERVALQTPPSGRGVEVRSVDGTRLHAEIFGPDAGSPIVLVHGWTENITYWTYVIRELVGRGFGIVALDLRGHGQSQPAVGEDYSLMRLGEDVEAVLEACVPEGRHAVLAGHSLGAMAIVAWAEHHDATRRVGAAALMNTGVGDLVAEQLLVPVPKIAHALNNVIAVRGFLGARAPLPRFSTPVSYWITRYIGFGPNSSPAQVAFYERMLATTPPDIRAKVGIAMSEMDLHHALPRLIVPTLVMAGENDRLTPPSHAARIAGQLPRLHRLMVLPETGHMGPLEQPGELSDALAELAAVASAASAVAA